MKDEVSTEYTNLEEGVTKQPAELFHIWYGSTHWRYTSAEEAITYSGNEFLPAGVKRGTVGYDSNLEVSVLEVTFARMTAPIAQYIALNPLELVWIEVLRVFREQSPVEAGVVFLGQIRSVSFVGLSCVAECVGFEHFLRQPVPVFRYGPQCNWTVFDSRCGVSSAAYTNAVYLTGVSSNGLELTGKFGVREDGFFSGGVLSWSGTSRMIVNHIGNSISLRYRIAGLQAGHTVSVYAGCDRNVETCRDKFDNVINFGGDPFIPDDNPTLWNI